MASNRLSQASLAIGQASRASHQLRLAQPVTSHFMQNKFRAFCIKLNVFEKIEREKVTTFLKSGRLGQSKCVFARMIIFHFFLISCTKVAWWRFCCHCLNTRHHKLRLRWLAKSKILVGKTIRGLETKSCWGKCCNPRNSNHNIEAAYISLPLSLCILFVYSLRSSIFSLVQVYLQLVTPRNGKE